MNNLAYSTQQADKVAGFVEEKLRKETTATVPIPFTTEQMDAGQTSAKTLLKDMKSTLFGGEANTLFKVIFDLTTPRAAQLQTFAVRQGIGCIINALVYSIVLAKTIAGEVTMGEGRPLFTGDPTASSKLNGKGDLVKRIDKFARTKSDVGGLTFTQPRYFSLMPLEIGCLLVIGTIPRTTGMGFDASLDAKEFFDIAAMIEGVL